MQIKTHCAQIRQLERTVAHTELRLLGLPDKNRTRREKVLQMQYIDDLQQMRTQIAKITEAQKSLKRELQRLREVSEIESKQREKRKLKKDLNKTIILG